MARLAGAGLNGRPSPGNRAGRGRAGFTMLEILLVLGLIALLTGSLVTVSMHLVGDRAATPEDVFWEASRSARKLALETGNDARLTFDEKEKTFVVGANGAPGQTFALPPVRGLTVDFLPPKQGRFSSVLIGGQLVDTNRLTAVTFYADGTCAPFRVQLRNEGAPARILNIDPWTCAPMLTTDEGSP